MQCKPNKGSSFSILNKLHSKKCDSREYEQQNRFYRRDALLAVNGSCETAISKLHEEEKRTKWGCLGKSSRNSRKKLNLLFFYLIISVPSRLNFLDL